MNEDYSQRFAGKDAVAEYAELYADGVENYANLIYHIEKGILSDIVESLPDDARAAAYLDFATGTGRILSHLEREFSESDGIDISEEMLAVCAQNTSSSTLRCVDITSEPITKKYGLITSFRFFLNAGSELGSSVMPALAARLAPEGRVVVNNHGRPFSANMIGALGRLLRVQKKQAIMSDKALVHLLNENGLVLERRVCYGVAGGRLARLFGYRLTSLIEERLTGTVIADLFGTCAIYVASRG